MNPRLQAMVVEHGEKIETVNRERKHQQVHFIILRLLLFGNHITFMFVFCYSVWCICLFFSCVVLFINDLLHQQNAGSELHVLSAQWRELSLKNIEIQEACARIANLLEELRKEAVER